MTRSDQSLEKLRALKRHEVPGDAYWQDFLIEFHRRHQQQPVTKSGIRTFLNRALTSLAAVGPIRWSWAAALAYAMVTVAFLLAPQDAPVETIPISPVIHITPSSVKPFDRLESSPSSRGNRNGQVFKGYPSGIPAAPTI